MKFFLPALLLTAVSFSNISAFSTGSTIKIHSGLTASSSAHENLFSGDDSTYSEEYLDSLMNILDFDSSMVDSVMHPFPRSKDEGSSTFPIAIGVASFLYLFNPIILFENDKIALGFTKEVSIGFGRFGQHRASFEYSYIFRKDLNSIIRVGYKWDMLLKPGIQPSNLLQGTPALSLGVGYFHNFSRPGYFAETSYGYSIRNDKLLFYPSMKLRYTYVVKGADVYDFSFGLIIGIANPFIDLKIRNEY